jgi:hypothetical protein
MVDLNLCLEILNTMVLIFLVSKFIIVKWGSFNFRGAHPSNLDMNKYL